MQLDLDTNESSSVQTPKAISKFLFNNNKKKDVPVISLLVNNEKLDFEISKENLKLNAKNRPPPDTRINNMKKENVSQMLTETIIQIPERKISNTSFTSANSSSIASCSDSSNLSAISNCSYICYCCSCYNQKSQQTGTYLLSPNTIIKNRHHHHQCNQQQQQQQSHNEKNLKVPINLTVPVILIKDRNVYSTPSSPIPDQITKWIEQQNNTEICTFSKSVPDFNNNSRFKMKSSKDICGTVDRLKTVNNCCCNQRSKSESLLKPIASTPSNLSPINIKTSTDNVFFSLNQNQEQKEESFSNDLFYYSVCDQTKQVTKNCNCCCDTSSTSATSLPELTLQTESKTKQLFPQSSHDQVISGCEFFNKYFDPTTTTTTQNEIDSLSTTRKSLKKNLKTKVKSRLSKLVNFFPSTSTSSLSQNNSSVIKSSDEYSMIKKVDELSIEEEPKANRIERLRNFSSNAIDKIIAIKNPTQIEPSTVSSPAAATRIKVSFSKFSKKNSKSTSELDNLAVNKIKRESSSSFKTNNKKKQQKSKNNASKSHATSPTM